jgi:thymidine kinase
MAKLYFHYSAMNAGKTTVLLQSSYNYQEHGMSVFLLTAAIDTRAGRGIIASRIGLSAKASVYTDNDNLFQMVQDLPHEIACVFVDEAQFLTDEQAWQLSDITDKLNIPVMSYGLRTDFKGNLFSGSARLLAIADVIKEIKTICWCGKKATMVLRIQGDGSVAENGAQIAIGGNDQYLSLCRKHWKSKKLKPVEPTGPMITPSIV